jgi:hypothetical protein
VNSVKVEVRLVDGGAQDWTFGSEFLAKLAALDAQGLTGKDLIHALLSDDWGAPPVIVTIIWTGSDGRRHVRKIEYD